VVERASILGYAYARKTPIVCLAQNVAAGHANYRPAKALPIVQKDRFAAEKMGIGLANNAAKIPIAVHLEV